jgi:hypothetical protein
MEISTASQTINVTDTTAPVIAGLLQTSTIMLLLLLL